MGVTTAIGAGLTGLGVGAETAAAAAPVLFDVGAGAAGGAALGGGTAALTGGNVGQGILHGGESGAITGGGIGAGEAALGGTLGNTAAGALGGAAGGALGQSVTGGNALTGAIGGGIAGGLAGSANTPSGTPTTGGSGASAGALAAPAGVPSSASPFDTTSFDNTVSNLQNASPLTASPNVGAGVTSSGTQSLANNAGTATFDINGNIGGGASPSLVSASGAANAAGGATGDNPLTTAFHDLTDHPSLANLGKLATASPSADISALGLGYEAIQGAKANAAEKSLAAQAGQENAQGQQLESYLASGTLPPGLQAGVNQATQSIIANIKSRYAAQGASGSSAEQQDIANAQAQAQATGAQMAMQLMSQGISETGMASQLYEQIMKSQTESDTNLGSAISNFASAAAGGGNFGKGGEFKLVQN